MTLTIKGVQRFAVSNDRQRIIVIKFIVKLVRVGVWLSGLRRTGAVMRCVMLLISVICITALRADGKTGELLTYMLNVQFLISRMLAGTLVANSIYFHLSLP